MVMAMVMETGMVTDDDEAEVEKEEEEEEEARTSSEPSEARQAIERASTLQGAHCLKMRSAAPKVCPTYRLTVCHLLFVPQTPHKTCFP